PLGLRQSPVHWSRQSESEPQRHGAAAQTAVALHPSLQQHRNAAALCFPNRHPAHLRALPFLPPQPAPLLLPGSAPERPQRALRWLRQGPGTFFIRVDVAACPLTVPMEVSPFLLSAVPAVPCSRPPRCSTVAGS